MHNIVRKIEVTLVARGPVEQHHRFQHAGGRQAVVQARVNDAPLGGKSCQEQIADLATDLEGSFVAGILVVGKQAEDVVLVPTGLKCSFGRNLKLAFTVEP